MAEIAISVAAKVSEYLVAPIARPIGYVWNYKSDFDSLETEIRKLKDRKDEVQKAAVEAGRQGEEIFEHVQSWLERVQRMVDEASEVVQEHEQESMKCFKGLCPNLKKRYQHGRRAAKKAKAVAELREEGNFTTVSYRTTPEETWLPSYKGYETFESRTSTLKEIIDALIDPDVSMVGVYGLGGIGKTTLAREVAAHAEAKKLFNIVAFAEVAVKPDIKEIQLKIADRLGLTFREESLPGRASRLQERLKKEEKVLLVLDNIWGRLNLEDVGIPFGDDHQGCKLLLTTRDLHVLSNEMNCQKNFEIGVLDEGEALRLFTKKAGDYIENNDSFRDLVTDVAKACKGLPIAINSVAVALKDKEDYVWKNALQELSTHSPRNFEGVAAETYSSIKISYDQLKGDEIKSIFLLCSTMPNIYIEDLLRYAMGLDVFSGIKTMEGARNRANALVQQLKESSLLLDANAERISIHDVVRDVGRSIASEDGHTITVIDYHVRWRDDKDKWKTLGGISIHDVSELPEQLECPHLRFLYVRTFNDKLKIPDKFFTKMQKLRVLHLVGFDLSSLPTSLCQLEDLRTLLVRHWISGLSCSRDIALVGELKKLEILAISDYHLERLPEEICTLTGLRLLDLSTYSRLLVIPANFIASLIQLEELYLVDSSIEWDVQGGGNASVDELKSLPLLTSLKIVIPNANVISKGLFSQKLERYQIRIGRPSYGPRFHRYLDLNLGDGCSCFEDVLHKTPSVKMVLSALDGGKGFPKLKQLSVHRSSCFRTVADHSQSESCDPFPFWRNWLLRS